jgi:hypothetical protein
VPPAEVLAAMGIRDPSPVLPGHVHAWAAADDAAWAAAQQHQDAANVQGMP